MKHQRTPSKQCSGLLTATGGRGAPPSACSRRRARALCSGEKPTIYEDAAGGSRNSEEQVLLSRPATLVELRRLGHAAMNDLLGLIVRGAAREIELRSRVGAKLELDFVLVEHARIAAGLWLGNAAGRDVAIEPVDLAA